MFDFVIKRIIPHQVQHYQLIERGTPLTYAAVLNLWQSDQKFRDFFIQVLNGSPFLGYRWETPAIAHTTIERPFEFVLINTPSFSARKPDPNPYKRYFTHDGIDSSIVTFPNLGGDATLIVPSPQTGDLAYGHLAAFIRNAPKDQIHALLRVMSAQAQAQVGSKPLWINTAGGGVAWLHIRLDSQPKYYNYAPYKTA